MRQHLALLLIATIGLGGCTAVDEATEDHPVRAPGQSGYLVMPALGETIESVAQRYDVSKETLVQANHLKFPYILQPHQTLVVPPPASYRVHNGDTVAGIATILGVDETALARANGLQKPYHMTIGQVLTVPGGIGGNVAPARVEEPGFTGVAPVPRSSISTQTLAPPPGVAPGGAGQFGPPPPQSLAPPPQPSIPPQQPLPASPTALAPQSLAPPPSRHIPPAPPAAVASASGAPTAIVPSAPAPAAPPPPQPVAPPIAEAAPQIASGGAPHFIRPVSGQVVEGFGADGSGQTNDGINIAAAAGTPVKAADSGTVIYTGNELAAFGNLILVRHAGGFVTAYGHLASIGVQRGQTVTQGQPLGTVGQTGSATSPQLHFEIRQGSKPVDPAPYLNGGKG